MNELTPQKPVTAAPAEKLVYFPRADGSRIPYKVYSSPEIYDLEQERIFRGPVWSFVALEAEVPSPAISRALLSATRRWWSRAMRTEALRYGSTAALIGARWFAARRTAMQKATSAFTISGAMTRAVICWECHFATVSKGRRACRPISILRSTACSNCASTATGASSSQLSAIWLRWLNDYLGPKMRPGLDRIFHKPIVYLGCSRQYAKSNWKLYLENVRDNYHASLLHAFFSTFNLYRATTTRTEVVGEQNDLHNCTWGFHTEDASGGAAYKESGVSSFKEGLKLEDLSFLTNKKEFDEGAFQSKPSSPSSLSSRSKTAW